MLSSLTEQTKQLLTQTSTTFGMQFIIIIILVALIFISIFWWVYGKLTLDNANCQRMNKLYNNFPPIHTINIGNQQFSNNLRDYYIKTAYNCCSAGTNKNDFVNVCALKKCISLVWCLICKETLSNWFHICKF